MVKKKAIQKTTAQRSSEANDKYIKALDSIMSTKGTLQTDIVSIIQNVINEINNDVQTGSGTIEKMISNITDCQKLKDLKPKIVISTDLPFKLKTFSHLLLGELSDKMLHDQKIIETLIGDVEALMVAIFVKEFSKNNKYDIGHFLNLVNVRIQVLKALDEANANKMT